MKKQEKIQNMMMKDLFSHHESPEPSSSFEEQVMYRISMERKYNPEIYRPVIGRMGWIVISVVAFVLVFLSVYFGNGGVGYLDRLFSIKTKLNFPGIEISGLMQRVEEIFSSTSSVVIYVLAGMLGMISILIAQQMFERRTLSKK